METQPLNQPKKHANPLPDIPAAAKLRRAIRADVKAAEAGGGVQGPRQFQGCSQPPRSYMG